MPNNVIFSHSQCLCISLEIHKQGGRDSNAPFFIKNKYL